MSKGQITKKSEKKAPLKTKQENDNLSFPAEFYLEPIQFKT